MDRHYKIVIGGGIAPVLIIQNLFGSDLCRRLIKYAEAAGFRKSGYMRDVGGRTVELHDHIFKSRSACVISDDHLQEEMAERFRTHIGPRIKEAFLINTTHYERHLVARYSSDCQDHFSPHRDNTTVGTAHRQFACTINLNSEEYEGGHLRFPEFGTITYQAPSGSALLFSCSLLHEVMPVTKGSRYAVPPFFYDEAAAEIRQRNLHLIGAYR